MTSINLAPSAKARETLEYLENVGLTKKEIERAFLRCPKLSGVDLDDTLKPAFQFLLEIGISNDKSGKLRKVINSCPQVLVYSVSEKLQKSVIFLEGLGINRKELFFIVTRFPSILTRNVEEKFCPLLAFLQSLEISPSVLSRLIIASPRLLSYSIDAKLRPTVTYFLSLGLSVFEVGKIVTKCPQIFCYNIDERLKPAVKFLKDLGLENEILRYVIVKAPHLLGRKVSLVLEPRTEYLSTIGLTNSEIKCIVAKFPSVLTKSVDRWLQPWVQFVTQEIHLSVKEFALHPQLFSKNLKRVVLPRYKALKENNKDFIGLIDLVFCGSKKFSDRFGVEVTYLQRRM